MIQLSVPEVALLKLMRDQADARVIGFWEIYKTLVDLLQSKYGVSSTDSTVLWLRGATEANAGRGAFSALIRGYPESQYQLRYGRSIPTSPTDSLQDASNAVAGNLLDDILGNNAPAWPKGQVPNIDQIAIADATAVGRELFNRDPDDTAAALNSNSAWSGSLLFSLLRSDQTNRLMQGGGDPAKIDTLNDWRDVLYAYRSYEAGVKATIAGATTTTALALLGTPLQKVQALATQATDLAIMGATLYGYASSGSGDLQSATIAGTPNPTLKSAFGTIGGSGANRFLDMLMGAVQGKQLLGTTTDTDFAANAKTFFDLTPSQLQVSEAKRLPSKASDIAALAKTDVNARAALVAGSIVSIKVSDAVAGLDALKLYDSTAGMGSGLNTVRIAKLSLIKSMAYGGFQL